MWKQPRSGLETLVVKLEAFSVTSIYDEPSSPLLMQSSFVCTIGGDTRAYQRG